MCTHNGGPAVPASAFGLTSKEIASNEAGVGPGKPLVNENPTPKYYDFKYKGFKLDPYRIMLIYKIFHPAHHQLAKKALRVGTGKDSLESDLKGIIQAAQRWLEMIEEDKE